MIFAANYVDFVPGPFVDCIRTARVFFSCGFLLFVLLTLVLSDAKTAFDASYKAFGKFAIERTHTLVCQIEKYHKGLECNENNDMTDEKSVVIHRVYISCKLEIDSNRGSLLQYLIITQLYHAKEEVQDYPELHIFHRLYRQEFVEFVGFRIIAQKHEFVEPVRNHEKYERYEV